MRRLLVGFMVLLACVPLAFADNGLVSIKSAHDVKTTANRLETSLKEKGMTVFMRVDHAAAGRKVGKQLRPTELLVFGNPKVGTPLMLCAQTAGIDLPQKALIWEDENGQVWLSYNDPKYLAERHGITECAETITKIEDALSKFAIAATQP